ncbi:hypothetical protein MPSEU_000002900 [Mayamaea pseudoterrestris]|nr:hypothetical protein MPSEU_000002900 [Mayamaea pseudoterrestris]
MRFIHSVSLLLPMDRRVRSIIHRCISSRAARSLLGLPPHASQELTMMDIRFAYFKRAKECHPDIVRGSSSNDNDDNDVAAAHSDFIKVTLAYEVLQQELTGRSGSSNNDIIISQSEEESFRIACEQQLGLSAELVEECKTCEAFREWLTGNTDAAHTWRDFFMQHGGLAPRLNASVGVIGAGSSARGVGSRRKRR